MSAAAFPDQPLGDQSPCTILGNLPITPPVETALVIGKFPRRWGWLGKLLKTPFELSLRRGGCCLCGEERLAFAA